MSPTLMDPRFGGEWYGPFSKPSTPPRYTCANHTTHHPDRSRRALIAPGHSKVHASPTRVMTAKQRRRRGCRHQRTMRSSRLRTGRDFSRHATTVAGCANRPLTSDNSGRASQSASAIEARGIRLTANGRRTSRNTDLTTPRPTCLAGCPRSDERRRAAVTIEPTARGWDVDERPAR